MSHRNRTTRRIKRKTHDAKPGKLAPDKKKIRWHIWVALIGVLVLSSFLNTCALDWGQTGDVSWAPDSIDGRITAIYLPYLSKKWTHKYPRGHYLVSSIFYTPKMEQWKNDPVAVKLPSGKITRTSLDQKRLYELATISRGITVFMSLGILVAVFLTARKLCDDDAAGILSCLCLALSCHFLYYSKTACVDIPAFFWFAWAGCFGLYAIKSNNLFLYLLAGFCASWSVCTKEGVATFHIGLAVALAILLVHSKMKEGQLFKKAMLSLLNWKILAAVAIAVLVFVTLQGMWSGLDEWHYRSQHWQRVVQSEFQSKGLRTATLFRKTYEGLHAGWGGPFIILLPLSLLYWIVKYRWRLCLTVLPLLSFFCFTVLVIGENLPRFMMCGYAGISIIMGKALADWYRFKRIPLAVRHIFPLFVLLPSFICCICFDLEMKNDSRVRVEQWMRTSAKSQSIVGLSMVKQNAPRIWLDGFRIIPKWDSNGIETKEGKMKIWPDYIISSNKWRYGSKTDGAFFKKMFKGETEYKKKAEFKRLYFNRKTYVWKYCLRFFKLQYRISPPMFIFIKEDGTV